MFYIYYIYVLRTNKHIKYMAKFKIKSMIPVIPIKYFTLKKNPVLKIFSILFLTALSVIILYALYHGIRKATYMHRLKHDFYKLKEMGIEIQNFNIHYCNELKRKWPTNAFKVLNKKKTEFKNKNAIGMISDKYIILDFDTKDDIPQANFILDMIPKDTAYEKTPNGYHYYFENDTENIIKTRVQIVVNNIKYQLDILGSDSLVYMSPTCIGGKEYYWINSIFTHKPAKLSENMWIFDLIKDTKPFFKKYDNINIKLSITNALIIVNNIYIESQVHFIFGNNKQHSKKIKYLNGYIYLYDDNYFFLTNSSLNNTKNKSYLLNKMRELIIQINPSCIIDLSIMNTSSNYYKPNSIFQVSSAFMDDSCYKNYKNISPISNYIELNKNLMHKTKYLIQDTITIINPNDSVLVSNQIVTTSSTSTSTSLSKGLFGSESIYFSLLLSSEFNIPNVTLGIIGQKDAKNVRKAYIDTSCEIFNSFIILF